MKRIFIEVVSAGCMLVFLAACATVGNGGTRRDGGSMAGVTGTLPGGASVYIAAEIPQIRPLLDPLLHHFRMENKTSRMILTKTNFLSAALFSAADADPFVAELHGRAYPAFWADISFAFNKNWNRKKAGAARYWHSPHFGLALAVSAKKIRAAKNNPYFSESAAAVPAVFIAWSGEAIAGGWLPGAALLNRYLKQQGIAVNFPAKAIYFALDGVSGVNGSDRVGGAGGSGKAGGSGGDARRYRLRFNIEAESAARALSIQSLLNITKGALEEGGFDRRRLPEIVKIILRAETIVDGRHVLMVTETIDEAAVIEMIKTGATYIKR